jgi:transposase InsO family protein
VRFAFIDAQKAFHSVAVLCDVLAVSRSGYYAWSARPDSARSKEDARLAVDIVAIHRRSRRSYGSPRIHRELRERGQRVGRKRIARLMKQRGIAARRKKRFRATTDSKHSFPVAHNLLARDFTASAPNLAWVTDITYIPTHEGWLYLAAILDLFSRRVVGWAMSDRIDRQLTLDALQMALRARTPSSGLLHHSDRGSQYASDDYQKALGELGIRCSMSRKGDCWDNAVAESFFATLKVELVNEADFPTREAARTAIADYIDDFYNLERRHSHNGYVSPVMFELKAQVAAKAA